MVVKRYSLLVAMLLMATLVFTGCPSGGGKSFAQMSPTEKASYMMSVYNSQYNDYMSQVGYTKNDAGQWIPPAVPPELTEAQKNTLRSKKDLLTKVYKAIQLYKGQMQFGGIPSMETEQQIMDMLNQMGGLIQ
jgi:hypothetical protein